VARERRGGAEKGAVQDVLKKCTNSRALTFRSASQDRKKNARATLSPLERENQSRGARRRPGYLFAFSRGEKVVEVRDRMRGRSSPFEGPGFIKPPALPGDT
jgi:hypothetical protein